MTDFNKAKQLPDGQKVTIKLRTEDGLTERKVVAPLPDGFGMSVGSAFTDPQNMDLNQGGGAVSKAVKAVTQRSGFSSKIAQASNVFYDGPEPTEMSFDLNFHAYYSAFDEVIVPVFDLMMMSVGREYNGDEINNSIVADAMKAIEEATGADSGKYGLIHSPGECKVTFGKAMTIPRCFVSSVGVEFSNIMDNQYFPISANCSVTIKVVRNPTQTELTKYFNRTNYKAERTDN